MLVRIAVVAAVIGIAWTAASRSSPLRSSPPRFANVRACGDSASLSWEPSTPARGSLFLVRVTGSSATQLTGTAVGEALHFSADSSRESFAAVPIDGVDSIDVVVRCVADGAIDSLAARIATVKGDYPIERLRVAPAFGRRPDSATLARTQRESRRAAQVAENAHTTPRMWDSTFMLPRDSRITSGFGGGREFNGTITSRHMGADFAGATGAPVRAMNRGVVRIVDAFFYGGNVVYIDHGNGLSSAYLHLSQQLVAVGDTVARGQVIGRVGATGRVTGPHLHLIVRYGSVTVDPMSVFALAGEQK